MPIVLSLLSEMQPESEVEVWKSLQFAVNLSKQVYSGKIMDLHFYFYFTDS